MGICIPESNKVSITVDGETRHWEEGLSLNDIDLIVYRTSDDF